MTHPFPNAYSHPLPRFQYYPSTGYISVLFSADPNALMSRGTDQLESRMNSQSVDWRAKRYVLTCIPKRAPRTLVDDETEFINATATKIASPITRFFSPIGPRSTITADEVAQGQIDL